jgi:hypothetical protein
MDSHLRYAVTTAVLALLLSSTADGVLAEGPERPFRGRSQEEAVASCAGGFGALYEGVGNATHLGLFTDSICTVTTGGAFPRFNFVGEGSVTAANGDQLFVTAHGVTDVSNDPCVAQGVLTVVGGTGRFANASGTTQVTALLPWIGQYTCGPEQTTTSVGRIRY